MHLLRKEELLPPVEQENDRSGQLVKLVHNTYATNSYSTTLPLNVNQQNGTAPSFTDYTINNYDPTGNILQVLPVNGVSDAYIWDYKVSYPVAKVTNATSQDIAYTSFEADGTGNWAIGSGAFDTTVAITGHKSFNLSGSITKSGLNISTTYFVTYWTLGNTGSFNIAGTISGYPTKGKTVSFNNAIWTLYVHKVTGQSTITVSGTGHVDELRLYPSTAQMTTFAYDPLSA